MEFRPHSYQRHCINKILETKKLGLFLDMGLGKTVTTLTAVKELKYNRFQVCKVLVIAPKKVAEGTWTKEAAKWNHTKMLRVSPVLGSQAKRIRALNTPADLYVINRENVCWLVDYYRNAWPFDMVVIDESSSFKSHSAKRFKALAGISSRISRMVELTGTPVPQRPGGPVEPGLSAGRRGTAGKTVQPVPRAVLPAGQARGRRHDIQL